MAVFPAASKQHVPEPWGDLMSNPVSNKFIINSLVISINAFNFC